MTIHEPGSEPERPDRAGDDDTQRLDPVAEPTAPQEPPTAPLAAADAAEDDTVRLDTVRLEKLPPNEAQDGETRVLPADAQPSGVDSLWDLGSPEAAPSPAAPQPAFARPPLAPSSTPGVSAPEAAAPEPTRSRRRSVRVGTVVWGLVVVACGVLALAAARGASIDGGTVAIAILGGAGVALVLGSIVTGVRRRDRA
ncbi:hypothetical protein GCM10025864_03920 [Luteimicrobium album]|uniref:Uncharacterized protein n=1 Tax=Luteimicrobium album TaxID=1054550 RepID=A0ABQ6HVU5_9MICO|nr:hypothetical protein [Luteimicrobium album]GMA22633.1 hypothetical protein GCM10025864_03920 [Luteimicrobium album]